VPDDAFMIMELEESRLWRVSGIARYRPEFAGAM
jgi:predicted N-acetyltransferase YhbS